MPESTSRIETEALPRAREPLDPSVEEMRRLGYAVVDRLVVHLATLSQQRVARRGSADDFAALVDEPLPVEGHGMDETLRFFFDRVVPDLPKVNHPRFHAYIPVPGSFYGTLGALLAAGTNAFTGSWLGGGTLASLELTVLRWIAEIVGYDPGAAGILTSGGSVANLSAVAAARSRHGRNTLDDGVLYLSEQGHASVEKAAVLLGYRLEAIRRIAVDEHFRMSVEALREAVAEDRRRELRPFFVGASAGTTNTGSVDPLTELAALCRDEGLWFHVDGAYGGFAALCPEGRSRLRGMNEADSLTLDPHKWLYSPMGTGCLLVRDRSALEAAFSTSGEYLKDIPAEEVSFFNRGPELSRPARVLAVWTLLRTVGVERIRRQMEHDLALARLAEDLLAASRHFEIVCPTELSIVTFRHRILPGESEEDRGRRDDTLMEATLSDGEIMISSTILGGRNALRLVVQNHRTDEQEVRRSVAALERLAARQRS